MGGASAAPGRSRRGIMAQPERCLEGGAFSRSVSIMTLVHFRPETRRWSVFGVSPERSTSSTGSTAPHRGLLANAVTVHHKPGEHSVAKRCWRGAPPARFALAEWTAWTVWTSWRETRLTDAPRTADTQAPRLPKANEVSGCATWPIRFAISTRGIPRRGA